MASGHFYSLVRCMGGFPMSMSLLHKDSLSLIPGVAEDRQAFQLLT
jgi:hypothetical protein